MVRLLGYYANQSDRLRCAITLDGAGLDTAADEVVAGWGVGSYQQDEVLLRRKPVDTRDAPALIDALAGLRTDCALVHAGSPDGPRRTLENTEPFRFRQWMFAARGTVADRDATARLRETIPDFLVRNVRGDTADETLFYAWLGVVHETGRLDDNLFDDASLGESLREVVARLDAVGGARGAFAVLATNHAAFGAVQRGVPLHWTRRAGIRDCAACRKTPDVSGREPRRIDHEQLRYVLVTASDTAPASNWYALEGERGAILTIDGTVDARVHEL